MQIVLLTALGPDVRKILCTWNASEITVHAFFDGAIREDDADAMLEIETDMMAGRLHRDIPRSVNGTVPRS
jgi:hypothetical protein